MAQYNAIAGMNAYGYGNTRDGITPHSLSILAPFPEYYVHKNQSYFVQTGSLFVPDLGINGATKQGLIITYCNPGWAYKARNVFRPTWVPLRQDFVDLQGDPGDPTIDDAYDHFSNVGTDPNYQAERTVFYAQVAGTISWGRRAYFNNDFKMMLVGVNSKFTAQPILFPYTNPNNPRPELNVDGIQKGTIIKFFTEDEFSLITFKQVQDIYADMNYDPFE